MPVLPHTVRKFRLVATALRSDEVSSLRKFVLAITCAAMLLPEIGFDLADFLTGVGIPLDVVAVIAEYVGDGFLLSLVLFFLLPKTVRNSADNAQFDDELRSFERELDGRRKR